ncbi:MAG: TM2 domain-containing protein [Bacteroidetes bacterium]|nr:MAG: TM2 domain-containing protein [Bacteroidota bacterium]MBL1143808.1 TM2 domain-containing protein [Bacteroidota bacterium]NOG56609.1 TM2 domain-containing protein [Bacteroidota bacterium]
MRLLFLGLLLISACVVYSSNYQADIFILEDSSILIEMNTNSFQDTDNTTFIPKHRKLKAVLLAVFLGHFGVHRIYLGTSPNVPIVYSLTLGGGLGLLPLIDVYAILKSKNLNEFKDSQQVFMWTTPR